MRIQSAAVIASFGVSHEPPTHATLGSARKSGAFAAVTPPVGQNVMSGNGPASAFSMPMPPACSAGKSFSSVKPAALAAMTSEGVMTPGNSGRLARSAASPNAGVRPGLTPKRAPAATACAKSSGRVIVPTPTIAPSTWRAIAATAPMPAGVRNVTSSTRTPPATNALASGTAWSTSSITITGITGPTRIISRTSTASLLSIHARARKQIRTAGESLFRAGERELYLHRPRLVACELEGLDRLLDRIRGSQEWPHIDATIGNQVDRPAELNGGSECAAHLELLGHDRVHRQCRFTPESDQHHGTERSRNFERAHQRTWVTGAFERHVEISLVMHVRRQRIGLLGHIEGSIGTDLRRRGERRRADIRHHDLACAALPRGDDRQAADRPASRYQYLLAEHRAGTGRRVQRHRKRHRECLLLRDDDLVTERTLDVRKAHCTAVEAHIETLVGMSFDAVATVTARAARVDRYAIADADPRDTSADRGHDAGHFVSEDHRFLQANRAESAMLVVMQIGSADSARGESHLYLTGTRTARRRHVFDSQIEGSVNDN